VAVESSTLTRSRLAVGDHTSALIGGQPRPVTITGEVKFDAPLAGATIVLVDEPTARQTFAPDGTVPSFSLTAAPGVSQQELVRRVSAVLPADAEVVTGAKVAEENRKDIEQALGFIRIFLFVFAAVSLFVGAFIIFNTFSMLVRPADPRARAAPRGRGVPRPGDPRRSRRGGPGRPGRLDPRPRPGARAGRGAAGLLRGRSAWRSPAGCRCCRTR
jgi:hypothetical protein